MTWFLCPGHRQGKEGLSRVHQKSRSLSSGPTPGSRLYLGPFPA